VARLSYDQDSVKAQDNARTLTQAELGDHVSAIMIALENTSHAATECAEVKALHVLPTLLSVQQASLTTVRLVSPFPSCFALSVNPKSLTAF
jgi:hypothetical protein